MEDVKEECSKFGSITHTYVDRNSKVQSDLSGYTTTATCLLYLLLECQFKLPTACYVYCLDVNSNFPQISIFWEIPQQIPGMTASDKLMTHKGAQYLMQTLTVWIYYVVQGFVYLKFANMEGAAAAQQSLHGRWFAGNQVVAEFQFQQPYMEYFRCT